MELKTEVHQQTGDKLIRLLVFTLTISVMSAYMFAIVLPQIREEFGLTNAEVSWVTSAYGLIYAIGAVTYGKLADRYKLKNLLTFGLLFFVFGSLIGLASQTYWMMLVGRCLQSIGASAIPAIAMMIPVRYIAPERRGAAIGMVTVGLALGSALGPVLAAFIVSIAHWRWLFCVPLLILLTIPYYRKYLGDEQGKPGKFDWIGGGLLAVTVVLLLLGVTNGTLLTMIGGFFVLALFIMRIRYAEEPFVQPKLFLNKKYTLGLVIVFLISGVGFSLVFLSPLLLTQVQQLSASWIGFAMVPAAIASAILGRKAGKLADAKGNSYLFFLASGLLLICFISLSTFTAISPVFIALFLIFGNVGQSFILIAMSNSISMTLPKEQVGVGMGMFSMLNFIAASMATGAYSRILDYGSEVHFNPVNLYPDGIIYSNIYLVLALMHAGVLVMYYFGFGSRKKANGLDNASSL